MKLKREERNYYHLPFWGIDTTPQIQIGETADYVDMTVAPTYEPPETWEAPTGFEAAEAVWYQILIAGPDAPSNPVGTVVITATSRVRTKVTAGDEIDIQPDGPDEWITLVP